MNRQHRTPSVAAFGYNNQMKILWEKTASKLQGHDAQYVSVDKFYALQLKQKSPRVFQ